MEASVAKIEKPDPCRPWTEPAGRDNVSRARGRRTGLGYQLFFAGEACSYEVRAPSGRAITPRRHIIFY